MLVIIIIIAVCTLGLTSTIDPDFGWHLYLSRYIHQTGHLPQVLTGYWSFPNYGLIDDEWLTHYLLGFMSMSGYDYTFLVLLVGAIALATYLIVYKNLLGRGFTKTVATFVTTLLLINLPTVFGVRVQVLLLFGAAVLFYLIPKIKNVNWRRAVYFITFALGTNLHSGFLLLATIPIALETVPIIDSWEQGKRGRQLMPSIRTYSITLLWVALSTLTVPYGIKFWELGLGYMSDNYYQDHIMEWLPVSSFPLVYLGITIPLSIGAFLAIYRTQRKIPVSPSYALLLMLWLFMGLLHVRFLPILLIISAPFLSESCKYLFSEMAIDNRFLKILTSACWLLVVLLVVAADSSTFNFGQMGWPINPAKATGYPEAALNYLKSNYSGACQGHLLNPYGWGGYILGFSNQSVFIDGRGPQLKLSNNTTILQEYNRSLDPKQLTQIVSQYNIRCVLVGPPPSNQVVKRGVFASILDDGALNSKAKESVTWNSYFGTQPNWQKVFSDNTAKIYIFSSSSYNAATTN